MASTLGTDISSSEIVNDTILSEDIFDGTITNSDLASSSLTVTAGSGLANGGAVSLGGTVTLNIGAGSGIAVNADDIAVDLTVATDGLSSTTSSGSGLEVLGSGLTLLQGCGNSQLLKWNEATDTWDCSNDSTSGAGPDSLDYIDFEDTLNLDATTTTVLGASNLITNLDSTGDVIFQDNGSTFLSLSDSGALDITLDATDNPSFTLTNAGSGNVVTNLSGTGDFIIQDNGTPSFVVSDAGAVNIGDPASAIATGSLLVLDNITTDPSGTAGAMYYNSTSAKFRCYQGSVWTDCIPEVDTATFQDTSPAAFADNDTTEVFNDATKPNITVSSATSTVLVTFNLDGVSNTANDAFFAARVVFATGGVDPTCASTQVGRPKISTFTTAATHPYSIEGSFVHTPGVSGEIRYTVCSSAAATGTITDTPNNVSISLVELGS